MAARPRQGIAASTKQTGREPLPSRLAPARGVVLGVCLGALIWAVLIVAYVYTR